LINITQTYTSSGIPYQFPIDTQMSSKRSKKEKVGKIAKQSCQNQLKKLIKGSCDYSEISKPYESLSTQKTAKGQPENELMMRINNIERYLNENTL